jgi:hypothetical protein
MSEQPDTGRSLSKPKLGPCPDCGHQVSSRAVACPSCGRGIKFQTQIFSAIFWVTILFSVLGFIIAVVFSTIAALERGAFTH